MKAIETARVKSLWERQAKEVQSGRFQVILFRFSDGSATLLDRGEAVKRVEALGPNPEVAAIESMFDDLVPLGWAKQKSYLWGTKVDFVFDGPKISNVYHSKRGKDIRIFDGRDEVDYDAANHQASLNSGRSGVSQVDLDAIRTIPSRWISWEGNLAIAPDGDREAVLRSGGLTVRFDQESGFVKRLTRTRGGEIVIDEILQLAPTPIDGVILPKVAVHMDFKKDKVNMLSLYLTRSASINIAIEPEEFRLPVPADTLVVDYRRDRTNPLFFKTPVALQDVTEYEILRPR